MMAARKPGAAKDRMRSIEHYTLGLAKDPDRGRNAVTSPKRLLIDTMVVDLIADTCGLLGRVQRAIANGLVTIVETHILRDQLSATRCEGRRVRLLEAYDALTKATVTTSGVGLDVSTLDKADLGDENLRDLVTPGRGGMQDALLASTASGKADVLVTRDVDLRKKAKNLPCELWDLDEFRRFIEEHP